LDLGLLQHLSGSTLWHLTSTQAIWNSSTRALRLQFAHQQYTAWCHMNHIADIADVWKPDAFRAQNGFPQLTSLKAAEQRWLVVWVHATLRALPDKGGPDKGGLENLLRVCYACAVGFDVVCRGHGRHLPADALARAQACGEGFLTAYNASALYCIQKGWALFRVVPKNHMCTHLLNMAEAANPRVVHNYADESMIGSLKKIAASCHPDAISHRVVDRYRLLMLVKLANWPS